MSLRDELDAILYPQKDVLKGTIGLSEDIVNVTNRPGYIWVRLLDNPNEAVKVHNSKVSPKFGLPIEVTFDGRKYEVKGVDTNRYSNWLSVSSFLPDHGPQHSAMRGSEGEDIVWVDNQQFLPLLVIPSDGTGTHSVTISPYSYRNSLGDWLYIGVSGTNDLSPVGGVSGSNLYLLMLNDADGSIYAITGSVSYTPITEERDILNSLPAIPSTSSFEDKPLAAVKVTPNVRVGWPDIYNLRQFFSNSAKRGYGGFYAYNKSILFQIDTVDTYHAFHLITAGDLVAGVLLGWTFNAGRLVDGNITSEANGTGGKLRIICSAAHGLVTGDLIVLTNMNNAGHNKSTRITIDGTNPTTEFLCNDISYVAGAGASAGNVDMPAYLKVGRGYGGVYHVGFTIDGQAAGANKNWKFEINIEITAQDNLVSERTTSATIASMTATGNIVVADGDRVWLSGKNSTDTSDYTVKNFNMNLFKL